MNSFRNLSGLSRMASAPSTRSRRCRSLTDGGEAEQLAGSVPPRSPDAAYAAGGISARTLIEPVAARAEVHEVPRRVARRNACFDTAWTVCASPTRYDVDTGTLADYDTNYSTVTDPSRSALRSTSQQPLHPLYPAGAGPRPRTAEFVGLVDELRRTPSPPRRPEKPGDGGTERIVALDLLGILTNPEPPAGRAR
jgi:hypothetical protein